ncbi:hypothetical protein D5S17_35785 [Pseudonocardiaceae bacterium YIM PH 21723]|nr:hypothetical protein D5S17_35785 [Pseudonocardiaceae bacterium YIM PH 21723]
MRAAVTEVCSRFASAALSSNAEIDRGPGNARYRAAQQFGSPEFARNDQFREGDGAWPLLAEHRARVVVNTYEVGDDPPPPRRDTASAAVTAKRVAVAADGWRQDLSTFVVYCTMTDAGGWKITAASFYEDPSSRPR